MTVYQQKLLEALLSNEAQGVGNVMLDVLADQEVRICKLELGIKE